MPPIHRPDADRRAEQQALLAELERLSQGRGLSFAERKRLGEHIDAAYVDAEIVRHERHLHFARRFLRPMAVLYLVGVAAFAGYVLIVAGGAEWERLIAPVALSFSAVAIFLAIRHTRRRIAVLERLRALAPNAS